MVIRKKPNRITGFKKNTHRAGRISRKLLALLVGVGVIVLLTACSGGATTSKPAIATTQPAANTLTPKKGGILKIGHNNEPTIFGIPWRAQGASGDWLTMVCEPLLVSTQQLGVYQPVLAESWQLSADKTSITFKLRQGVKFHDGTNFNAAAVKWNREKVVAYQGPNVAALSPLASVDVIDDYTVRFNLRFWNAIIYDYFTGPTNTIMSPNAYDKNGEEWCLTHPVGTGPWIYKDYARGQYLKFDRNPNYWRNNGMPYLDEVDINVMKDTMVTSASMINGDINAWREADADSVNQLQAKGFISETLGGGNIVLFYNSTDPASPWSDLKMRQALEYAVDKATIASALGKGFAAPLYEELPGINIIGKSQGVPRTFNTDKAKQLMSEAGYPNGLSCKLVLNTAMNTPAVMALQNQLAKVGINITIDPQVNAVWRDLTTKPPVGSELRLDRQAGGYGTIIQQTNSDFGRASIFFPGITKPDGWFDTLDKVLITEDPAQRLTLLQELDKAAYDNLMLCPLWTVYDMVVYVNNLKANLPGGRGTAIFRPIRFEYAWFEK